MINDMEKGQESMMSQKPREERSSSLPEVLQRGSSKIGTVSGTGLAREKSRKLDTNGLGCQGDKG